MKLVFPGEPMPKQSARFRIVGKGKKSFISSYQKKSVKDNSKKMSLEAKAQLPAGFKPLDGPLAVNILFVFPPLKSWSKKKLAELEAGEVIYKPTKPDWDNTVKQFADSLEGVLFTNDSRICKAEVQKIYGTQPRTEIEFYEL